MRLITKINLTIGTMAVLSLSTPVFALEHSHDQTGTEKEVTATSQTEPESNDTVPNPTAKQKLEQKQQTAQTKLEDAKLKVCQVHEKTIDNIMGRIATRGQKQLDLFSTIAQRTETFYTNKGKTLSNYDALVADVDAKKTAAQTALTTISSDKVDFKCDGTDPKGVASGFKTDLQTEQQALKDYKTAVKNLIVGVKSVQSTTTSGGDTTND